MKDLPDTKGWAHQTAMVRGASATVVTCSGVVARTLLNPRLRYVDNYIS